MRASSVTNRKQRFVVVAVAAFAAAGFTATTGLTAHAATVSSSTPVSCDMNITKHAFRTVAHHPNGNIWLRQDGSSPNSTTTVWAYRESGGSLTPKNVGNGGTAEWLGRAAGNYVFSAKRSTSMDCTVLPGLGNYTFSYTIVY